MKAKILLLVLFVVSIVSVTSSCERINVSQTQNVNITYVYNNGDENKTETVYAAAFQKPGDPVRLGYKFVGWCTDEELTNFYNFEVSPSQTTVLYAKWEIDYENLLENTGTDALLFNVKVCTEFIKGSSKNISQGSGVIFNKNDGYYYALTNYHVVENSSYTNGDYYVFDAYGNEYRATKIAGSPEYDLAVLRFSSKKGVSLSVAVIDERIPSNVETLISISSPNGRFNSITFGRAVNYETVSIGSGSELSKVEFDVLWLDCYAEHGSSGGAVIDTDFEIIGLVYAVATEKNSNFKYSLAIPAEKINEFLNANGFLIGK